MNRHLVYYDRWTGSIQAISKQKQNIDHPFIEVDSVVVEPIIRGDVSESQYIVAWDAMEYRMDFIKRDRTIRFRPPEKEQYLIPKSSSPSTSDIVFKVYTEEKTAEIIINIARFIPSYRSRYFRGDVKFEEGIYLEFLLLDENGKQRQIRLDPSNTLEGRAFFDLSDLTLGDNISVCTRRVVQKYCLVIDALRQYVPQDDELKTFQKAVRDQNLFCHLEISSSGESTLIKNNIIRVDELRLGSDLVLYVVDRQNYNRLFGKFVVQQKDLAERKDVTIPKSFDFSRKDVLYDNRYLSILIRGEAVS